MCEECIISNLSAVTAKFHIIAMFVHQALVLCPGCVRERVGINQKGINQK
jgi:hypothetical protein